MVKLTINLRSKYNFFFLSGLCFIFFIYHISNMMVSIDLSGWDKALFFIIPIFTTLLFWTPFQFNELFV